MDAKCDDVAANELSLKATYERLRTAWMLSGQEEKKKRELSMVAGCGHRSKIVLNLAYVALLLELPSDALQYSKAALQDVDSDCLYVIVYIVWIASTNKSARIGPMHTFT